MQKLKYFIALSLFSMADVFAAGSYTLNGTFGCVASPNFSGFNNRLTNGSGSSSAGNFLFFAKFTTGSSVVSMSGVSNNINNYEQRNSSNSTTVVSNINHFNYTPNNPIENMYLLEDTSTTPPFKSYFILVNSGKTLMGIDAPTVDKNSNMVCQAL